MGAFTQHEVKTLDGDIVKPIRASGTRWIAHREKALKTLHRNYVALCAAFEEWASGERGDVSATDAAKVKGYLKKMNSEKFEFYVAALYLDLLDGLSCLSLSL